MKKVWSVLLLALVLVSTGCNKDPAQKLAKQKWYGYETFGTFSKAADVDEFFGRPLDEEGFRTLLALAFFSSFLSDDGVSFDFVSGNKLSERYGVSEKHRNDYNYLVSSTGSMAYFNGELWVVIYSK
ncbi:MAG: hypothetical protein Ta2A_12600 [Treponemataceae bacterium]|nr:MAG: hypothetical protein Ta2A_12600 [Treponemataceae bacterium]